MEIPNLEEGETFSFGLEMWLVCWRWFGCMVPKPAVRVSVRVMSVDSVLYMI